MNYDNQAVFRHVEREVFNAVADRIRADKSAGADVMIYYNGTALYGDVTIKYISGYPENYKKALRIFNEEYCKQ